MWSISHLLPFPKRSLVIGTVVLNQSFTRITFELLGHMIGRKIYSRITQDDSPAILTNQAKKYSEK